MAKSEWLEKHFHSLFATPDSPYRPKYTSITRSFDET